MNRKSTTDSKRKGTSSSFHVNASLFDSNLNDHNADDEYSSSTHTDNSSSSGDLSSDIHQYGFQQPLNIIRPPSYASMMAHNAKNKDYNSSSPSLNEIAEYALSPLSSTYSFLISPGQPLKRKASIYGPTANRQQRITFLGIISLMTFCGANNDFLGKLCYQSLSGIHS